MLNLRESAGNFMKNETINSNHELTQRKVKRLSQRDHATLKAFLNNKGPSGRWNQFIIICLR